VNSTLVTYYEREYLNPGALEALDADFVAQYLGISLPLAELWTDHIHSHLWNNGSDLEYWLLDWLLFTAPKAYTPKWMSPAEERWWKAEAEAWAKQARIVIDEELSKKPVQFFLSPGSYSSTLKLIIPRPMV